jgi:hypothetical protein
MVFPVIIVNVICCYNFKMNTKQKTLLIAPLIVAVSLTQADALKSALEMQDAQDKAEIMDLSTMLLAGDVEALKNTAIDGVVEKGVGVTRSFLEQYFPTVELNFGAQGGSKPSGGLLVVAPLSNQSDIFNTYFTQGSVFYQDNRTTLNLGLGYRKLSDNKMLLTGINAFYDHEFPYDHGRTSVGVEARTTVWEINANKYWATTKWKTGKSGLEERALDGYDIEAGVPLPYMNWATVFVKNFKGNDVQLRAYIPGIDGLEIQAGRILYSDSTGTDESYINISYNVTELFKDKPSNTAQWFSKDAYKLASMEDRRYEKVRRTNNIVKQLKASGSIKVKGY